MSGELILYVDGAPRLQVARSDGVPGQLRALFKRLDADMDGGIELDGRAIPMPDAGQRARYALGHLLDALAADKLDFARSLLLYIAARLPELQAVRVDAQADTWQVELDFR